MRTFLAATAIALTMVSSAHCGVRLPNGYSLNGVWENGLWENGVYENGIFQNGLGSNGRTSTTKVRPDTFAGSQAIGSANLIAIELPHR
jgi:hypothetical protein